MPLEELEDEDDDDKLEQDELDVVAEVDVREDDVVEMDAVTEVAAVVALAEVERPSVELAIEEELDDVALSESGVGAS